MLMSVYYGGFKRNVTELILCYIILTTSSLLCKRFGLIHLRNFSVFKPNATGSLCYRLNSERPMLDYDGQTTFIPRWVSSRCDCKKMSGSLFLRKATTVNTAHFSAIAVAFRNIRAWMKVVRPSPPLRAEPVSVFDVLP